MLYKIKPCCLLCEHAGLRDGGVRCEHVRVGGEAFSEAECEYEDVCELFELRDFGYDVGVE